MRFYFLALILFAFIQQNTWVGYTQTLLPLPKEETDLVPYRKGDLWGYSDISGHVVITPKYRYVDFFSHGLAFVELVDSISPSGEKIEEQAIISKNKTLLKRDFGGSVTILNDTLILVNKTNGAIHGTFSYLLDINGNEYSLGSPYDIGFFENHVVLSFYQSKYQLVDFRGNFIRNTTHDSVWTIGFYDANHNLIYTPKSVCGNIENTFIHIKRKDDNFGTEHFMTKKGEFISSHNFKYFKTDSEDHTCPSLFNSGVAIIWKNDQVGVVDSNGNTIIPFGKYDNIESFSEGMAMAYIGEEMVFISNSGVELKLSEGLTEPVKFHEGYARVEVDNSKAYYGFIDKQGKLYKLKKMYEVVGHFSEGLCKVFSNGKWGFISIQGKEIFPLNLDYEQVGDFSEGLCWVMKDQKYGFIDRTGKEVIPLNLDYAQSFKGGYCEITKVDKWDHEQIDVIDSTGTQMNYQFSSDQPWINGYRIIYDPVSRNQGVVNSAHRVIIPMDYTYVRINSIGLAIAVNNGKHIGYINLKTGVRYFEN